MRYTYVGEIIYDDKNAMLKLTFNDVLDSNTNRILKELIFTDVQSFTQTIDSNFEDDCFDTLMGIDTYEEEKTNKYVISTDQREISFSSKPQPIVKNYEQL